MKKKEQLQKVTMGGGGLRLSVERRRIENAKMSALRYRRFQEFHKCIQEEEMRKVSEVLERRKKEKERLNKYIHSLHQPLLKSNINSQFQSNDELNKHNQYIQRPPWNLTFLKNKKTTIKLLQKENSLVDAQLFGLKQPEYDVMLQIRATSICDALVDLKACNSQYPLNDADQCTCPLIEDSYLKNHFLQSEPSNNAFSNIQSEQHNLQDDANNNCSISNLCIDKLSNAIQASTKSSPLEHVSYTSPNSLKCENNMLNSPLGLLKKSSPISKKFNEEELNKFDTIIDVDATFQRNCTDEFKVKDLQTNLSDITPVEVSTKFWNGSDGKTTNYLTKELFLSSLESEAPTTRLVEEISTLQSNSWRLIPMQFNHLSSKDSYSSKTPSNISSKNIEYQNPNIHLKTNQYFQYGVSNSLVEDRELRNTNYIKPTSKASQHIHLMEHNISPCLFNEKQQSFIVSKDNATSICDAQCDMITNDTINFPLEEIQTIKVPKKQLFQPSIINDDPNFNIKFIQQGSPSTRVLFAPNLKLLHDTDNESKIGSIDSDLKPRCSLENRMHFEDNVENQGRTNAFSTTSFISQQVRSSNSSCSKNQFRIGSKKLDIPQRILQSVYERCNLDALKSRGYSNLCGVAHFKKEKNAKPSENNILPSDVKDSTIEEITSTLSCINDVNFKNYKNSCVDVESMYYKFSRNKENFGKENFYANLCIPRLEEEFNILASLKRLDWKLAAITNRSLNSQRNSLTSEGGQLSSKSAQSALATITHDGPSSTTLGQINLTIEKAKKNCNNLFRPSSARMIPKKPPRSHRQRQVVGVTNKNQGRSLYKVHSKSEVDIQPSHVIMNVKNKVAPSIPGSIVCYKDPHCLFSPIPSIRGVVS